MVFCGGGTETEKAEKVAIQNGNFQSGLQMVDDGGGTRCLPDGVKVRSRSWSIKILGNRLEIEADRGVLACLDL